MFPEIAACVRKQLEKAALDGGAKTAVWETTTKVLTVKYDAKKTDAIKIQQSVANTGYDTKDIKGNDSAYEKLHACCKYDRTKTYASAKK